MLKSPYGVDGAPVTDLFEPGLTFEIPPLGSRVMRSPGTGAIRRGWIQVRTGTDSVSGLLTYRQSETGVEVSVKPVELGNQFALFMEESPAIGAGVAIFKPDAAPKIELRIRDEEGNDPLDGVFIPRGDSRQLARTLPEWIGAGGVDTGFLADFRGLLFLRSGDDSQFAPLGLRFGKTNSSLSSVPAIRIADGGGIGGGQIPPPTVALSVSPGVINWGESATLTWSSTNAASVEITPDIGAVAASGSRKVSPRATTTYRITVRGAGGRTQTAAVTVRVVVSERAALTALYEYASGTNWTDSANWGTGRPLGTWHGVEVDGQGRVTGLILNSNGLEGRVAGSLGRLSQMTELRIGGNALSGRLPLSLSLLPALQEFHYGDTQLCVPAEESFRAWIGAVPSHEGTAVDCPAPTDRDVLLALYDATGGPNWNHRENWLTNRPLEDWHGVDVGEDGRVTVLNLSNNNLAGRIPPELGSLASLTRVSLAQNRLTGSIPPELGSLSELRGLVLSKNDLTGSIPAELGALANLEVVRLQGNDLRDSVPPVIGGLEKLSSLVLAGNGGLSERCPPAWRISAAWRNFWPPARTSARLPRPDSRTGSPAS